MNRPSYDPGSRSLLHLDSSATSHWVGLITFLSFHLMCVSVFWAGISWELVSLAVASYYIRMFGITAGYHRYFSHRSYRTSRLFQFVLAFLAMTSGQKGVLWWAAHHRHHHRHSDQPEDYHSPLQKGFWFSHVGWLLSDRYLTTDTKLVQDLSHYPELRALNRFYLVPPLMYALAIYAVWGVPGLVWGFCISTTVLYHCTFFINSLTHMVGRVRYKSRDGSRNSFILAVLCCGEGWHNNHHYYQLAVNQGWFWWEVDFSYYALKGLSWLGIVWDLKTPPAHIKAGSLVKHKQEYRAMAACASRLIELRR